MQVGPSRELFELWAPDARNGLIITGYSIEGTLARVSAKWFWDRYLLLPVHNMQQWTIFFIPLLSATFRFSSSFHFIHSLCIRCELSAYGFSDRTS